MADPKMATKRWNSIDFDETVFEVPDFESNRKIWKFEMADTIWSLIFKSV